MSSRSRWWRTRGFFVEHKSILIGSGTGVLFVILLIVSIFVGKAIRERWLTAYLKRLPVVYNDVRDVL